MKKVTVPARRIHNTSHQSTSVAAYHMCEKRWKGRSQRRDTQSSGLALPSTKPSAGSVAHANTYRLIIRAVRCASPRHVQPTNRRPQPPSYQVASNTTNRSCHTHDVMWWREGERQRDIIMTTSRRSIKLSAGAAGAASARG